MLRLVCIMAVTLLLSFAAAGSLPDNARVTLIGEGGVVVGVGEVQDGNLTLTLDSGARGFVTLLIESEDGTVVATEAVITAEGRLLVVTETGVEDVFAEIQDAGGTGAVAFEDRIAQGVEDVSSLPEGAQAGMARAAENHAAARAKAAAAGKNGGADPDEAEDGEDGDGEGEEPTDDGEGEEPTDDGEGEEPTDDGEGDDAGAGADAGVGVDVGTAAAGVAATVSVGVGASANGGAN